MNVKLILKIYPWKFENLGVWCLSMDFVHIGKTRDLSLYISFFFFFLNFGIFIFSLYPKKKRDAWKLKYFYLKNILKPISFCISGVAGNDKSEMSGHDSKYFSTTKKGEIPELKEELNSQYKVAAHSQLNLL